MHAERLSSLLIKQVFVSSPGVPCSEADYKRWSPSDEHGNDCLLGREIMFKRRAPHATCFNGEEFDRPVTISNCSCTRQDYEWLESPRALKHLIESVGMFSNRSRFVTVPVESGKSFVLMGKFKTLKLVLQAVCLFPFDFKSFVE